MAATLYKNEKAKATVHQLYQEKLDSLQIPHKSINVETTFGNTHILTTGNENGEKVVLFHGINAGAPIALEAVKELREKYHFFAIDTIGQATKSAPTKMNLNDDSYAVWADEVLEQLGLEKANFIGISYGGFILQKLITHRPERVAKCIFVVPAGLVNGAFMPSITQLTFPLLRFMVTKKEAHLQAFLRAFVPAEDTFMQRLQRALLLDVNIDFRRPPLLKKQEVAHFSKPVYMMVADQDIFFPRTAAVKKARQIFKNLQAVHVLKNSKHTPAKSDFPEIQRVIDEWIEKG